MIRTVCFKNGHYAIYHLINYYCKAESKTVQLQMIRYQKQTKTDKKQSYVYYPRISMAFLQKLLILYFFINNLALVLCFENNTAISQLVTLSQSIYEGQRTITYIQEKNYYEQYIYFPNIEEQTTTLFVKDIKQYQGIVPVNNNLRFVNDWRTSGFNFTLTKEIKKPYLILKLNVGQGVKFKQIKVGFLISGDLAFIVGNTAAIKQKCSKNCQHSRQWKSSFIVQCPQQANIFIPFITSLIAYAPQPTIQFIDVFPQALNKTHRIIHVIMKLQSLHPIQQLRLAYIAHNSNKSKFILKTMQANNLSKTTNKNNFYGIISINSSIKTNQQLQQSFFKFIGISFSKQFFLSINKNDKPNTIYNS